MGDTKWLVVTTEEYYPRVGVFNSREGAENAYKEIIRDYEGMAKYFREEIVNEDMRDVKESKESAERYDNIQVYITKVEGRRLD